MTRESLTTSWAGYAVFESASPGANRVANAAADLPIAVLSLTLLARTHGGRRRIAFIYRGAWQ